MRLISIALAIFFFAAVTAYASTGMDMLAGCRNLADGLTFGKGGESENALRCGGMIEGAAVAFSVDKTVCLPHGWSPMQAAKVAVKFMDDHPESLNEEMVTIIAFVISYTWPCDSKKSKPNVP